MCGIAGWFSRTPPHPAQADGLNSMIQAIRHRGPDGQGTLFSGHAALGHCRLAIIDPEGGKQPMSALDGEISIVFNGEIYNFAAIKKELADHGHRFITHSDTEVILHLYREEGWRGFSRLRGMYAFAIWDNRKNRGLIARDPLGIKPVFWKTGEEGELIFASEAKAILAREAQQAEMDECALHLLLNFRYLPGKLSLFRGIRQLGAGEVLEWSPDGRSSVHVIPDAAPTGAADTLECLHESVRLHLTADVEVGAYLSGGMDSAAIAALVTRVGQQNLRTFSLDIGDDPDEMKNAARTAQLLGIQNIHGEVPTDVTTDLPRLIWHLEVPKINALQVNQVARLAAQHVKVVLSGLGGDELFLGYNAHKILHLAMRANHYLPQLLTRPGGAAAAELIAALPGPPWSEAERSLRMVSELGNWPRLYGLLRNLWDTPAMRRLIYGPRMLEQKLPDAFSVLEDHWPAHPNPVMAMADFEWRQKMVNDLLWQEDRASMAQGLEVRVPFVDMSLARHVRRLDAGTLMQNGKPKSYMRRILRPILPDEILTRPKSGFQVNAPDFFHAHLGQLAERLLDEATVRRTGLFNPAFVKKLRAIRPGKYRRWHYFLLYLMLATHLWVEVFEAGVSPPKAGRSRHAA